MLQSLQSDQAKIGLHRMYGDAGALGTDNASFERYLEKQNDFTKLCPKVGFKPLGTYEDDTQRYCNGTYVHGPIIRHYNCGPEIDGTYEYSLRMGFVTEQDADNFVEQFKDWRNESEQGYQSTYCVVAEN